MSQLECDGESFYRYAMELFVQTGHVSHLWAEFINHSPEQFVYFDNTQDISLSREQRAMLTLFNNISYLFVANGCAFFSINLLIEQRFRSQVAHNVHLLIHSVVAADRTICLFRCNNEVILSFVGCGDYCILSDWYAIDDDSGTLCNKLDIANMSIKNGSEYFSDMIHMLARRYYFYESEPIAHSLLPVDFINKGLERQELDEMIMHQLSSAEREYGDDYIACDGDEFIVPKAKIGADIDLILLEMDDGDDSLHNEMIKDNEEDSESKESIYEFENVDPEIFQDPTLMIKWLKEQEDSSS